MMGGYGYSSEYDMERLVRATLVSTIYGDASEIHAGSSPRPSASSRRKRSRTGRTLRSAASARHESANQYSIMTTKDYVEGRRIQPDP